MGQLAVLLPKGLALLSGYFLYYVLFLALIILASASYNLKSKRQKYAAAPITCVKDRPLAAARKRFKIEAQKMLREGYEEYKGLPFYVPTPLGERLMIPGKYVEELKTAPVDEVDFVGTFYEVQWSLSRAFILNDSKRNRCSKADIQPWVVAPPCTHASQKTN